MAFNDALNVGFCQRRIFEAVALPSVKDPRSESG
jgi:hypothetical protein